MAIQRILFPTDFSTNSETALNYAANVAGALNAEIILFYCYQYPPIATEIPLEGLEEEVNAVEKENKKRMSELIEYGLKINSSLKFDSIILFGDFTNYINDIVKKRSIDLIMMSTQGAGPLKSFFLGTNAATVIAKSSCPVFVIPQFYSFEKITHILYPCEYFDSDIRNLHFLATIAEPFNASITIVNITEEDYLLQAIITKKFEREVKNKITYPHIDFVCLEGKNLEERITDYANKNDIDLIVMSTRHRTKFEKIYDHSLTEKMAYHTSIPLLAFHVEEIFEEKS
jgi:nucleotide-binding universal stress UspA family protein